MTNMSQAPATEKRALAICWDLKSSACRSPLRICVNYTITFTFYNALPTDIVGGFAIMFIIGAIFGELASACQYSTNISVALR